MTKYYRFIATGLLTAVMLIFLTEQPSAQTFGTELDPPPQIPCETDYRVQNGLFLGPGLLGAESIYRHPGSPWLISVHGGLIAAEERLISGRDRFPFVGAVLGREISIGEREIDSRAEFYFRIGQGFGLASRNVFSNQTSVAYLGLTTQATIGAQYAITDRTAIFIHGGGRVHYFPALNKIKFRAGPVVNFGLQFRSTPDVPMGRV